MQKLKKMMMKGIKQNDLKKVAWALNLGLDINTLIDGRTLIDGSTPLHWAVVWDRIEMAKLLIASGADVNAKNKDDFTPLHEAVWRNNIETAKLLIDSGADVNAKRKDDSTPLHSAKFQKMRALLKRHGAVE